MCIALLSTSHPSYTLILIDNRDEFLNRPTAPAAWWPTPSDHVLGGRDLLRSAHGTWLGVTRDGRIAVLTNFREETAVAVGAESRGAMINAFLSNEKSSQQTTELFIKDLIASGAAQRVGGFSLVCGRIGEPLAVISNRVSSEKGISWVAAERDETVGLSNAAFGDRSWAKIVSGEKLLSEALAVSTEKNETEKELIDRLLALLSVDTLPRGRDSEDKLETRINQLRETIFVPLVGRDGVQSKASEEVRAGKAGETAHVVSGKQKLDSVGTSGLYGTQKQTVVLCRKDGNVRFFERTLYDSHSMPVEEGHGDRDLVFHIER